MVGDVGVNVPCITARVFVCVILTSHFAVPVGTAA